MPTPLKRMALEDIFVKRGLISDSMMEQLVSKALETQQPLKTVLLEEGIVSEEHIVQALAEQYGLPYEPLHEFRVDPEFFETIPVEWMHRYPFVPVSEDHGVLTIAIPNPQDVRVLDELELFLGRELRLVVSSQAAINEALAASEGNKQVLTRIQAELDPVLIKEDEKGEEILSVEQITKDQSPCCQAGQHHHSQRTTKTNE